MILAIVNQKGGVGKTTSAVNLAAAIAKQKKKVLLIDLDPQGNATSGVGLNKNELTKTTYEIVCEQIKLSEAIVSIENNFDFCPANVNLAASEVELVSVVSRETKLKNALVEVEKNYDFILIDCPPSLGLLTLNALTASDGVLIPIQAEFYALEGLTQLLATIRQVNEKINPELTVFGTLITMFDRRTQLARQVEIEIRKVFGDTVFKTVVPRNVRLSEAPSYGLPITSYDKHSKGAKAYLALAKEVIRRV